MIRTLLFAFALTASPLMAQEVPPAAPAQEARPASVAETQAPRPATVRVRLMTSAGPILLELEKERAPLTTANFLRYVDQKRLDGTSFYRAMTVRKEPLLGLVQGGVKGDQKRSLPPIPHEPTTKTGLSHVDGTISLARAAPGSATADFFILVGDLPSLDANPAASGDNQGFAAFGRVVEGMDAVKAILGSPTSATLGEGVMKGQMLEPGIRISSARRAD